MGSRRDDSFNKRLADDLGRIAPRAVSFKPVMIRDLPTFKRSVDADHTPAVKRLKSGITSAHALLFIAPEHDRALPGVLQFF